MLAAWYERPGPAAEVLQVGEMAEPEPGPGEVCVRVALSGVNPGDTKKRGDWVGWGLPFPRIVPHSDGSGVIDAVGRVRTDCLRRLRLIQRHSMRNGAADLIEVALARHRSDDRRAAPARKLGGQRADGAEHPLDQDRLARDGAVAEDRTMRGDARDPETRTRLIVDFSGELHSLLRGNNCQLRGGPEWAVGLRPV